jgi:hypothetical protein
MMQVEATIRGLTNLKTQAATLSGSASVLADNQLVVTKALIQLGLPSGAANTVAGALADAPAMLSQAPDSLGVAIEFLQVNLNQVSHSTTLLGGWGWGSGVEGGGGLRKR